ncbi:MAG: glycerate kinase [Bacillota bacterium]|nr:glycerate kinase [Bacillota bacterium]
MKVVIAPDKFKSSMTARDAATQISKGIEEILPEAELAISPLSDGGEGLMDCLAEIFQINRRTEVVTGPGGNPINAAWAISGDGKTAIIEMAAASGLHLLQPEERNPKTTTTFGTGELIKAVLDEGCEILILGIGGSATNDGGAGMAQALGVKFFDSNDHLLGFGGQELIKLTRIDTSELDNRLGNIRIKVACDVQNPLTGPEGASLIYSRQKGASDSDIETLESALKHYAEILNKDLGIDVTDIPGAGAAGGLGAGMTAFLNAELLPGIELVLDLINFDNLIKNSTLVITGEGKIDRQSLFGKTTIGVTKRANRYNIPVIALAGSIEGDLDKLHDEGICACFAIANGPMDLEESINRGPELLYSKTKELFRFLNINLKRK